MANPPNQLADRSAAVTMVKCTVCLKEIPRSEAKSPEGQDYLIYFCGLDCYDRWNQSRDKSTGGEL
jgi:hypothetical protein